MERIPVQSLGWRLFAVLIILLLWVMYGRSGDMPDLSWQGLKDIYWLLAPLGLAGFAFGFRPIGRTFWRFYAVIFTVELTFRTIRVLGSGGHALHVVLIYLTAAALVCLALFRYAELFPSRAARA